MSKKANPWFLRIFSLPFLCVGVFMLGWILKDFAAFMAAQSWEEVSAGILHVELRRNEDTQKAEAEYRYDYQGKTYHSKKIGLTDIADNIGSYQRETYRWLRHAMEQRQHVRAFVNPNDPSQSLLDRNIRWSMVLFRMIFVITFGGFGIGTWIGPWLYRKWQKGSFKPRQVSHSYGSSHDASKYSSDEPWHRVKRWTSDGISLKFWTFQTIFLACFGAIWCTISFSITFFALDDLSFSQEPQAFIIFIFPVVGLGFITFFAIKTFRYLRNSKCRLYLRPYPGQLGGIVQGTISLPPSLKMSSLQGKIKLSCIEHIVEKRANKTSYSSRERWKSELPLNKPQHGPDGLELPFKFTTPSELPESSPKLSMERTEWRISTSIPRSGPDLNLDYDIPVFKTQDSQDIPEDQADEDNLQAGGVDPVETLKNAGYRVEATSSRLQISDTLSNRLISTLPLLIFGGIWWSIIIFVIIPHAPLLFKIVFPFFGVLVLAALGHQMISVCKLKVENRKLHFKHLLTKETEIPLDAISGFSRYSKSATGNTKFYTLVIHENRKGKTIQHKSFYHIKGKDVAVMLERVIKNHIE